MSIPGHVDAARQYFLDALAQALVGGRRRTRASRAEAHKELGFYYRNLGSWIDADASYRRRDVLARIMAGDSGEVPRGNGLDPDQLGVPQGVARRLPGGTRLVDSAIAVRKRFSSRQWSAIR